MIKIIILQIIMTSCGVLYPFREKIDHQCSVHGIMYKEKNGVLGIVIDKNGLPVRCGKYE